MKALIVSENDVLVSNIRTWYSRDINNGSLTIDHARSKKEAEELLKENQYDTIMHNGIWIIKEIESYQRGATVIHYGESHNDIFKNHIDVHSPQGVKKIFKKKYLPFRVSIGQAVTTVISILVLLTSVIVFVVTLRANVDQNTAHIKEIKDDVSQIKEDMSAQAISFSILETYVRAKGEIDKEKSR